MSAVLLLSSCSGEFDTASDEAVDDGAPAASAPSELDTYREACADAASEATAVAQVDYPKTLSTRVDEPIDYQLVIDTTEAPLPPSTYVDGGDATTFPSPVRVACRLVARLTAGDSAHVDVTSASAGEDGWVDRSVNGAGLFQWAWTVTPHRPGTIHLTADVRPVVLNLSDPTNQTLSLVTDLSASGNWLQRLAWWVERQTAAARFVGGTALALVLWLGMAWARIVPLVPWRSKATPAKAKPKKRRTGTPTRAGTATSTH